MNALTPNASFRVGRLFMENVELTELHPRTFRKALAMAVLERPALVSRVGFPTRRHGRIMQHLGCRRLHDTWGDRLSTINWNHTEV